MIVYLASFKTIEKTWNRPTNDIYLLSSFWEHKTGKYGDYVTQDKHILDSGAFSAINDKTGKYKNFDWDEYVKKYIAFIKHTNQKLFFELDIDCVVGLSKLARTVDLYANRFQNQERITTQIAERIQKELNPKGVAVTLKAQHLCMCMRGVKKHDTWTVTNKLIGVFKDEDKARNEYLNIIK